MSSAAKSASISSEPADVRWRRSSSPESQDDEQPAGSGAAAATRRRLPYRQPSARELERQAQRRDGDDKKAHEGGAEGSGSPAALRKQKSGLHLGDKQESDEGGMPDFDVYPKYLREGPWSPAAYAYLGSVVAWLLWKCGEAFEERGKMSAPEVPWETRAILGALGCYAIGVQVQMVVTIGAWPYVSYTMVSYTFLTARFVAVALGMGVAAEFLRFPMLVMAWVTTTVWWTAIVPAMLFFMPPANRRKFIAFNFSFFLLNVHLFNLPLAMLDQHLTWRPLSLWDLWAGLVIAMVYLTFYLLVLDANGMHFYIILSPRRAWCCIPGYTVVFLVYVGIYSMLG